VVGASNEVPTEEALTAFYDRFLVRVPVAPVSEASFSALLTLAAGPPPPAAPVTREELSHWQAGRDAVPLADAVLAQLHTLRSFVTAQGIAVSDRRWRQLVGLLRTAALTEGRSEVDELDLWLVPYTLAAQPAQVPVLQAWFEQHAAQAAPQHAPWLTHAVEAFEKQLDIETTARTVEGDDAAGKLALARAIGGGNEGDDGMLRMVSTTLEAQLRPHYGPLHVAARRAQVAEVLAHACGHAEAVQAQADALARRLHARLWLPPELAQRMSQSLADTRARLQALVARLERTRDGFAALPIDPALQGDAPEPVTWPAAAQA